MLTGQQPHKTPPREMVEGFGRKISLMLSLLGADADAAGTLFASQ